MTRSMLLVSLMSVAVLAGCTTTTPEKRPFSHQERVELSLEALTRQALPYDQYVQARAALVRSQDATATGLAQEGASVPPAGRDS
jgi:predicted component of type VI protein secretion system